MKLLAPGVFAVAATAYVILAAAEANRQIRIHAYRTQLDVWQIKQNIAVREFLAGKTDKMEIVPAPKWGG